MLKLWNVFSDIPKKSKYLLNFYSGWLLQNEVDETVREIKSKGGSAYSYECDVSSCDDVKQAAAKVREDMQTVDILMNNAGVMCLNDILSLSENDIKRTININTVSHFWVRP